MDSEKQAASAGDAVQAAPTRRQLILGGAAAAGAAVLGAAESARPALAATSTGSGNIPSAQADLRGQLAPFPHVWEQVVGGDWAMQALRRDYQDQLFESHQELGVQSLRFHGIFNTRPAS